MQWAGQMPAYSGNSKSQLKAYYNHHAYYLTSPTHRIWSSRNRQHFQPRKGPTAAATAAAEAQSPTRPSGREGYVNVEKVSEAEVKFHNRRHHLHQRCVAGGLAQTASGHLSCSGCSVSHYAADQVQQSTVSWLRIPYPPDDSQNLQDSLAPCTALHYQSTRITHVACVIDQSCYQPSSAAAHHIRYISDSGYDLLQKLITCIALRCCGVRVRV